MFIFKTADTASGSQIFRPRTSLLRPLSHQRPITGNHLSPNPLRITQKSPAPRQLLQTAPHHEYYVQDRQIPKEKTRPFAASAKTIHGNNPYEADSLETLRKILEIRLEKCVLKFSEEMARQGDNLKKLQKRIQYQNQQIQTKNHIIKNLVNKLQRTRESEYFAVFGKRIEDLEKKMQILVQQIEEERAALAQTLQKITQKIVIHMGSKFNMTKSALSQFIVKNSKNLDKLDSQVTALRQNEHRKVILLQADLQWLQKAIKTIQESNCIRENCQQNNSSKDTASHNSSTSSHKTKNQGLFLSDYFFHPSETDSPCIKAIEQLAKDRLNQLPIRVYADSLGRLKYFQSRTYIFDRKGNFATASSGDLQVLQQRGWIKVVNQ